MATTWSVRTKPTTNWWARTQPETNWWARTRPTTYKTPLQDSYTMVADENDRIIYILANSWTLIPATFWKTRPVI
jgi:hypothetical protein